MHNGTLKNHWELLRKYKLEYSKYHVDSDVLAGCIDASNNSEPLKEIDGAAAVIFHDKRQPTRMFVYRNAERPLFRGHLGPNMYISSVIETLLLIGCINVKQFKENMIYTIEGGLIVGNPKKIKNIPYKEPTKTVVHTNTTSMYELNKMIGCNVRAKYDIPIMNTNNRRFTMIKDKYYEISHVVNNVCVRIKDDVTRETFIVGVTNLHLEDIIKPEDYVEALCDVRHRITTSRGVVVNQGDIRKVLGSFSDGDISFTDDVTTGVFFALKNKFRKLTGDELELYLETIGQVPFNLANAIGFSQTANARVSTKINNQCTIPLALNAAEVSKEAGVIPLPSDIITDPNSRTKLFLSMPINRLEDELSSYFLELDGILTDLKVQVNNYFNEEAALLINKIENMSWKTYNKIYDTEDANDTE